LWAGFVSISVGQRGSRGREKRPYKIGAPGENLRGDTPERGNVQMHVLIVNAGYPEREKGSSIL